MATLHNKGAHNTDACSYWPLVTTYLSISN